MEKLEQLRTQPLPKLIVSLSGPAVISLLTNSVNMAIDRMFIARGVGTLALSAVTVAFGLYLIVQACSQLIGVGASVATAIELGRGNIERAEKLVGNALLLSVALALMISIIGLFCLDPLLKLYGADGDNLSFAHSYGSVLFSGAICFVLAQSMNNIVRGMGYAKRSFLHFLSSILVNLVLDALFLFVFHWGVQGAALATVLGNLVCAILAIQFLCSKKMKVRLRLGNLNLRKETVIGILSLGVSGFIGQLALSLVSLALNRTCQMYGGTEAVAAYGIISTVFLLVYMPIIGLGQGIQPIVGYNYGAGLHSRVKAALWKAFQYGTCFCMFLFLLFEMFAPQIVSAFGGSQNEQMAITAVTGIRIYGLMLPTVGVQMIGANFFQFIGKIRTSMFLSALRQLLLFIPLALLLPVFFQMAGVWSAAPLSDFTSFVITVWLVRREWKRL